MLRLSLFFLAGTALGNVTEKFREFKKAFKPKGYKDSAEELYRFEIFAENVERAEKMNQIDSATHSHMSPLADQSEAEFSKLNNLKVTREELIEHEARAVTLKGDDLQSPSSYDWRQHGAVTHVKNQQQCGSCWSFATVANIEGQNYLQNKKLISLSEQELVDCDENDNGCNGGLPSNAYKDLISTKSGLELESAYPYTAQDGKCKAKKSLEKVYLSSWVAISTSETQMAAALVKYGPLAIGINAGPMQMYSGGISNPMFCNPQMLDHGVTLVAYGSEDGKDFWTIKNSWGSGWGEDGYYRIIRGKGKCGLNRMVTTAIVASSTKTNDEAPIEQYV